jgi:anthranilate synthase/aminodeoxychorismate synthase-like glutamine amidotransferase
LVLLVDNFDSFTYNLVDYLHRAGASCIVVRNDKPPAEVDMSGITGLMLSPGPETPEKAGYLLQYIELFHKKLPILGICLGHQAIGEFFGADLVKGIRPMHGKLSSVHLKKDQIFDSLPENIDVVRYNSLILKNLPQELVNIAETSEAEVMAVRHITLPVWGLQFHPEAALTREGLILLKNWVYSNKIA